MKVWSEGKETTWDGPVTELAAPGNSCPSLEEHSGEVGSKSRERGGSSYF